MLVKEDSTVTVKCKTTIKIYLCRYIVRISNDIC